MVGQSVVAAAGTAAAVAKIPKSTVESAVDALLKYKAAHSANEKLQLLPQDDCIYLNLTLKKIPTNPRTRPYQVSLSYPIMDPTSELCLIIDDRPQTPTPPSDEIKKLIKSQNILISKVLKISKLKSNYKPFEAKRKLCDSYDMFLVDKRVVHLLPKLIGKEFFKKKKLPFGVDLGKKNLKSQVERALGSALLYLRTGTCCVMKVGKVAMERDEIVENVIDAVNGAVEKLPKKWDGVRSLHLKFYDSVALPIYQAIPDVKLKIEGLKEREIGVEMDKISDNEVREASGRDEGKNGIKKRKKKGRIHEVRYMDAGEDVEGDDDGLDEIEQVRSEDVEELVGGDKVVEGDMIQESDDDNEGDADESKKIEIRDLSINNNVGKKSKKAKALSGGVNGEKQVKKKAKLEKSEVKNSKKDGQSSGEFPDKAKGKKKNKLGETSNKGIVKVKGAKCKKREAE